MADKKTGRPGFRDWIDRHPPPDWPLLPLTHLSNGLVASDILRAGRISPGEPDALGGPFAYFFYGRPAYRVGKDAVVQMEAACPFCFIFDSSLLRRAKDIHAFDTGAFAARLYKHVLIEDFRVQDFSLGSDASRPNKLIAAAFPDLESYLDANRQALISPESGAEAWEMEARAYLHLMASPGRDCSSSLA